MPETIESLQIELQSNSASAEKSINALVTSLTKLKTAVKGGLGLSAVSNQIKSVNSAVSSIDGNSAENIDRMASSLSKLSALGSIKISSSLGNQLKKLASVTSQLSKSDFSGIERMTTALSGLNNIEKASGLKSTITQLQKLPALEKTLNEVDIDTFTSQINKLNNSLSPLANNLNTVSNSFSKLPTNIKKVTTATEKSTKANNKSKTSFFGLAGAIGVGVIAARKIANVLSDCITESNSYIESLNLFTVSMGKYANEAQNYAEKVSDLMGIDPGQFMRYEGVFNTIITGFGVVEDKAYTMSKNLTQLGYDLASFYNISFEDAMQKLQSGISGELEPLRRLGYDLSVARLQQEALNLGIKKSVNNMTQAEKSQLRYYAIMTQVTKAQGDMARTLNAPANQIRIFKAQVIQLARAVGNILIPTLNAILPYAIAVVKVLRKVANALAQLAGFTLPEVDYSSVNNASNAVNNLTNNTDDTNKALTTTNKKLKEIKNNLIGIDELNIISPDETDNNSGVGGTGTGADDFNVPLPTYDFTKGLNQSDELEKQIEEMLKKIGLITGLAAMGAGLILIGFHRYGLGAALLAFGAASAYTALKLMWNSLDNDTKEMLSTIGKVLGIALLGAGLILVAFGRVGLGVAMMFAGASALYTVASLNWKSLDTETKNTLNTIGKVVGIPLMAVGLIIGLTGVNVPLGIAMIALGAVALATAIGIDWKSMNGDVKGALNLIGTVLGVAMMGVGLILALSGAKIGIGIALIATGALALGKSFKPIWDSLDKPTKNSLTKIASIGGVALVGLGIILALTGAAVGPGIALIVSGISYLVSSIALNWDSMSEDVQDTLNLIAEIVSAASLVLGVILCLTGVGIGLGVALIAVGAAGLATEAVINWDMIYDEIKGVLDKIKQYAGSACLLALGIILALSGVNFPLGIDLIGKGASSLASGKPISWNSMTNEIGKQLDAISKRFTQFSKDFKKNPVKAVVSLVKDGWSTVQSWIENSWLGKKVKEFIGLWKDGWSTVGSWVKKSIGGAVNKGIGLIKSDWTYVSSFVKKYIGGAVNKGIGVVKSGWTYISDFVKKYIGGPVSKGIGLVSSGWKKVSEWVKQNIGGAVNKGIGLVGDGWKKVSDWVKKNIGDTVEVGITLVLKGAKAAGKFIKDIPDNWLTGMGFKAKGGYYDGSTWKQFANGGYIKGNNSGFWNSIPQYAGGTTATHGSLFVAGEAGAEVVGHIGGQTEVLNKSQISAAMENATVKGMAQFLDVWNVMTGQITTCTNAIIRAIVVTNTAKDNIINDNPNTMYQNSDVSRSVYDNGRNTYQNSNSNFSQEIKDFYTEYIEPTLKEIASDTKRQADKEEQTIVQVGNRTVYDAVVTQQKANGYNFVKR